MSKTPTVSEIENAFQPAQEADDPTRFSGRKEAVHDCYYGLLTRGANIAIVGNRGIGKSSLARQLIRIATGDNKLIDKITNEKSERLDFVAMYFACGDSVQNTEDLLQRLLTRSDCLHEWIYDIPKAKAEVEAYKPKIGAGIFCIEGEKRIENRTEKVLSVHTIDVVFSNVVQAIVNQQIAKNGILIVVDEFDRIKQPQGFASFLKALATNVPNVKFCLVGVAQDIKELMKEHESTDRLFAGSIIRLPAMSDQELTEIIRTAEKSIEDYIVFDINATRRLISLAQGHPYMVHLVGKFCFRYAFQERSPDISSADVDATLKRIAESGADPVLEGRYQKAVAISPHRESVLRALASKISRDGEVWTTEAYKVALDNDVDNSSQYVGQLVTEEYGAEIEKIRERFYRFKDSLFAAYINARPRQFPIQRQTESSQTA